MAAGEIKLGAHEDVGCSSLHGRPAVIGLDPSDHGVAKGPIILRDGEACVCHLEAALRQRQAYISQQLMVLREAGLIQDRRDGWNVYYSVVDARLYRVLDAARTLRAEAGQPPERRPPMAEGCPCPKCNPVGMVEEGQQR